MRRFSIKDLPSKYADMGYKISRMTTNDLKRWKEQACLDDEETGILYIERSNAIDCLFIGNSQPNDTDDITMTGISLAIYFDFNEIMVKAHSEVSIEYIEKSIDEIIAMQKHNHRLDSFETITNANTNEISIEKQPTEDLTRSELEEAIIKDIVKFNEFAVNKIKEYAPETQEVKVYPSSSYYNYRAEQIISYSKYTREYVYRYGIYPLAYLVERYVDYHNNEVFDYDIEDGCLYIWGGFANEDDNEEAEDVEISVQDEITDLIADESNYTNSDKKCECMKCEMQSLCMYKDKYQRLDTSLKLCFKLKENQVEIKAFIGRHLEDYKDIIDVRRTKREFVRNQLKDMLVALNINVVDCDYFINDYSLETVKITYANNSCKNINIDGDSLVAIVSNVIKRVV